MSTNLLDKPQLLEIIRYQKEIWYGQMVYEEEYSDILNFPITSFTRNGFGFEFFNQTPCIFLHFWISEPILHHNVVFFQFLSLLNVLEPPLI